MPQCRRSKPLTAGLPKKWHPDHHQGESASDIAYAEQMFRLITKAYQVLMGSAEAEQQDPAGNAGSEAAQGESSSEGSHANTFMTILKYVAILAVVAFVLWLVVKILNFIVSVLTASLLSHSSSLWSCMWFRMMQL